jgi:hypothetical protein
VNDVVDEALGPVGDTAAAGGFVGGADLGTPTKTSQAAPINSTNEMPRAASRAGVISAVPEKSDGHLCGHAR